MLNPQQLAAVEHCDSPLLVLAGAGSGKTSVITQKIAHLIARRKLAPSKIAAITFTNKAAREMRERVGKLVSSEDAQALTVSTFHALGLKFLQIEHARAGLRRGFSVLDADDSGGIIKELASGSSEWAVPEGHATNATGQFNIGDERTPQEVAAHIRKLGYEPVWKDWDAALTA